MINHILCEVLERSVQSRYQDIKRFGIYFEESNNSLFLSDMYVKPDCRGNGIGSQVMNEVIQFADSTKLPVVLIPEPEDETGTVKKLIAFYKKFGFTVNAGRKMDYSLSIPFATSMVRYPKA